MIPEDVGGYPVNYGFVPQTISYDGDPFDVLVLGPPLTGGTMIRGVVVGLMHMEDEKGLDSKVVLSTTGPDGRPLHALTADDQRVIGDYFNRYKQHDAKTFSRVPGWGTVADGHQVRRNHPCVLRTVPCAGRSSRAAWHGERGFGYLEFSTASHAFRTTRPCPGSAGAGSDTC